MNELISKWIIETINEYERAKQSVNYYKMKQMKLLLYELRLLRDRLAKSAV